MIPSQDSEQAWLTLLENTEEAFSALFRVCLASAMVNTPTTRRKGEFSAVASAFLAAAVYQYLFAPEAYNEAWKTLLPNGFGSAALRCESVAEVSEIL